MFGRSQAVLFVLGCVAVSGRAHADDAGAAPQGETVSASATCDKVMGPGRVRCAAELRPGAGETVRWADLQIVETPAFVSALKGRVGPADATREPAKWRFSFGLVARARGSADVTLRVRAVVCRGEVCRPEVLPVLAKVAVGD